MKKKPSVPGLRNNGTDDILEGGGGTGSGNRNRRSSVKKMFDDVVEGSRDTGKAGSPGVTQGGRTSRSAVIGRDRVADYTKKRRGEGAVAGAIAGGTAVVAGDAIKGMLADKKEPEKSKPLDLSGEDLDVLEEHMKKKSGGSLRRASGGGLGVGKALRGYGAVRKK